MGWWRFTAVRSPAKQQAAAAPARHLAAGARQGRGSISQRLAARSALRRLACYMSDASRRAVPRRASWAVPGLLLAAVVALLVWLNSGSSWRTGPAAPGLAPAARQQLRTACRHWAAVDRLGGCGHAFLPRPAWASSVSKNLLSTISPSHALQVHRRVCAGAAAGVPVLQAPAWCQLHMHRLCARPAAPCGMPSLPPVPAPPAARLQRGGAAVSAGAGATAAASRAPRLPDVGR